MVKLLTLILLTIGFAGKDARCQVSLNYSYLTACYKDAAKDSFEVEIKGIGTVMMHSLASDSTQDVGMTYYFIPQKKLSKPKRKIAELAGNLQIETWKNNSKIVFTKKVVDNEEVAIIDTRLHMLIEDIYLQVIIVCEGNMVYELDCFRDKNDTAFFNNITKKIIEKGCP